MDLNDHTNRRKHRRSHEKGDETDENDDEDHPSPKPWDNFLFEGKKYDEFLVGLVVCCLHIIDYEHDVHSFLYLRAYSLLILVQN